MAVRRLVKTLRDIRDNGPLMQTAGICINVAAMVGDEELAELKALLPKWPDRARSANFPVEGNAIDHMRDLNKWKNPRRLALLDWLIATLEKEELCSR